MWVELWSGCVVWGRSCCRLMCDSCFQETAQKMMQTTVPSEHQALGRKAKGFDRQKWDEREYFWPRHCELRASVLMTGSDKSRIVAEGNYHKFTKCKEAAEMSKSLLATGNRELVEVSAQCWAGGGFFFWRATLMLLRRARPIASGVWVSVRPMQRRIARTGARTGWAKR